jgi:23S rRNA A2030 N6-methylase RlmJ
MIKLDRILNKAENILGDPDHPSSATSRNNKRGRNAINLRGEKEKKAKSSSTSGNGLDRTESCNMLLTEEQRNGINQSKYMDEIVNSFFRCNQENDNSTPASAVWFDQRSLSEEKLNKLFSKDKKVPMIKDYSFEELRAFWNVHPRSAVLIDKTKEMMRINMNQFKESKEIIKRFEETTAKQQKIYEWKIIKGQLHEYRDSQLEAYNLLYHQNLQAEEHLRRLSSRSSNVFTGCKGTGVGFHTDANGGIGSIINPEGSKLFMFVDFEEFQSKKNELYDNELPAQAKLHIKPLNIDVLLQLKSFQWVILQFEQYLLWHGTHYHAIYNAANSIFVGVNMVAMIEQHILYWLDYVLGPERGFIEMDKHLRDKQLRVLSEIFSNNYKEARKYLSQATFTALLNRLSSNRPTNSLVTAPKQPVRKKLPHTLLNSAVNNESVLEEMISVIAANQYENDNSRKIFSTTGLNQHQMQQALNNLLNPEKRIEIIDNYSFASLKQLIKEKRTSAFIITDPNFSIEFDEKYLQELAAIFLQQKAKGVSYNDILSSGERLRVHHYTDQKLQEFNLIHHDDYLIDNELGYMNCIPSNSFFGLANTAAPFHLDAHGTIGKLFNGTGKKLFLFFDYWELMEEELEETLFDQKLKQKHGSKAAPVHIRKLLKLESFQWGILEPTQYILWPNGTFYHAVYNLSQSMFIGSPINCLTAEAASRWLKFLLNEDAHHGLTSKCLNFESFRSIVLKNLSSPAGKAEVPAKLRKRLNKLLQAAKRRHD